MYEPELWQWNDVSAAYQEADEFHHAETNHLFPQP
jgi:hypothetical protein